MTPGFELQISLFSSAKSCVFLWFCLFFVLFHVIRYGLKIFGVGEKVGGKISPLGGAFGEFSAVTEFFRMHYHPRYGRKRSKTLYARGRGARNRGAGAPAHPCAQGYAAQCALVCENLRRFCCLFSAASCGRVDHGRGVRPRAPALCAPGLNPAPVRVNPLRRFCRRRKCFCPRLQPPLRRAPDRWGGCPPPPRFTMPGELAGNPRRFAPVFGGFFVFLPYAGFTPARVSPVVCLRYPVWSLSASAFPKFLCCLF